MTVRLANGYVPPRRYALPNSMIVAVIADRYEGAVGGEIPASLLAALSAQARLETGGEPWNWNWGNVRGRAPDGSWTSFSAGEVLDGVEVVLPPGAANKFRAYDAPGVIDPRGAGCDDWLTIVCLGKFKPAADAAARGDVKGYVHELHRLGYFTANEQHYGHGILSVETTLARLPQMAAYFRSVHL